MDVTCNLGLTQAGNVNATVGQHRRRIIRREAWRIFINWKQIILKQLSCAKTTYKKQKKTKYKKRNHGMMFYQHSCRLRWSVSALEVHLYRALTFHFLWKRTNKAKTFTIFDESNEYVYLPTILLSNSISSPRLLPCGSSDLSADWSWDRRRAASKSLLYIFSSSDTLKNKHITLDHI